MAIIYIYPQNERAESKNSVLFTSKCSHKHKLKENNREISNLISLLLCLEILDN